MQLRSAWEFGTGWPLFFLRQWQRNATFASPDYSEYDGIEGD